MRFRQDACVTRHVMFDWIGLFRKNARYDAAISSYIRVIVKVGLASRSSSFEGNFVRSPIPTFNYCTEEVFLLPQPRVLLTQIM